MKAYFLPSLHVHGLSRTQADRTMQISMLGKQEKCLVGKWPITSTRNSSIRRDDLVPPNPRGTGSAALPFWAAKSWKYWWAALVTNTVHPSAQQTFGPYSNLQAKYTHPLPTEDTPQVSSYHGVQLKQQDPGITGMVSTSGLNWLLLIQRSMNLKVWYNTQNTVVEEGQNSCNDGGAAASLWQFWMLLADGRGPAPVLGVGGIPWLGLDSAAPQSIWLPPLGGFPLPLISLATSEVSIGGHVSLGAKQLSQPASCLRKIGGQRVVLNLQQS